MAESKSGSNAESYVIGNSPSLGGQRYVRLPACWYCFKSVTCLVMPVGSHMSKIPDKVALQLILLFVSIVIR